MIIEKNSGRNCCPKADKIISFYWEDSEEILKRSSRHHCGNFGFPPPPIGCWNCEEEIPVFIDKKFCSQECKEEY